MHEHKNAWKRIKKPQLQNCSEIIESVSKRI